MTGLTPHQKKMFGDRLATLDAALPGYRKAFRHLEKQMTDIIPNTAVVVTPWPCEFLPDLIEEGCLHEGKVRMTYGRPSRCHDNVMQQWRSKRFSAIGTGFGLSADGLWREHSWGLSRNGTIVETTANRTAYFGIRLVGDEAAAFAGKGTS